MAINLIPLDSQRRVLLTPGEGTRGAQLTDYVIRAVVDRPELADWDWINDLRVPVDDSSSDDIGRIAEAFDAVSTIPTWTVFVTRDPNLGLWAQVMDHQFKHRRHLIADSPEAALRLLEHKRAGAV